MLTIYCCILAFLIGLILFKSIDGLFLPRIKHLWLIIPTLAAEILLFVPGLTFYKDFLWLIVLIEYIPFFILLAMNSKDWVLALLGGGMLCNYLVSIYNLGTIPIIYTILDDPAMSGLVSNIKKGFVCRYSIALGGERLGLLIKRFYVPFLEIGYISIGDILVALGAFALILWMLNPRTAPVPATVKKVKSKHRHLAYKGKH